MIRRLELEGVGPAEHLTLEFGPRLNLLTGDNGLGKTFLLDVIWWGAARHWPGFPVMPRRRMNGSPARMAFRFEADSGGGGAEAHYRPASMDWSVRGLAPEEVERSAARLGLPDEPLWLPLVLVYAHVDGAFSVWDGSRQGALGGQATFRFSVESLRDGLRHVDPVTGQEGTLCNGLISDWVVWQLRRNDSFQALCRVLETISPGPSERLQPGQPQRVGLDAREYPTLAMPYGDVPIIHASAAVQRIVHLVYLLVWAWFENRAAARILGVPPARRFLFLLDEIEAHLHPRWHRVILRALLKVVRDLDPEAQVQLIATTHAPLVLASVEPWFDVQQDALFMFDLVGADVAVRKAEWHPRGDASAWLTSEVFDLGEARSLEAEHAITQAQEALLDPSVSPQRMREIHRDLHAVLKETDPFWPRWLATARHLAIEP